MRRTDPFSRCSPAALRQSECIRYVRQVDAAGADHSRDNVEPDLDATGTVIGQPAGGEALQTLLLYRINGLDRRAPVIGGAGLHLAEDQQATAPDNEIDLSSGSAVVSLEDPEPGATVVSRGGVFTCATKHAARVHASKIGVRYDGY